MVGRWEMIGIALVLAGLALYLFQWALEGAIHSRGAQTVPDLKGKSVTAALEMLSALNLGLKKESAEFNSSVPIASVIRQDPPGGTVVREGKIIRIVVSQGGETVLTPGVAGLPLRNAEMLLRQNQLLLGEVGESYSLRHSKGVVLSQDPKAESSVERNSLVNVVVSDGPPPAGVVLMPDFLRKNISEARSWAAGAEVQVKESKDSASLFPFGTILSQDPQPDAVLSAGSRVSFVISGRSGKPGEGPATQNFSYELPPGGSESLVRIVVVDKYGERELFNGLRKPGSKIDLPLQESGGARMKIYLNGILVEERDL